ncbi:hypothetical protein SMD44_p10159 (plasmid) [Streptomyces alboflavus]|uniref:CobQ/CobB/MinD/ParA nucleotide binding domain-containing protein n=1 Tax=Streptomyces alboflavus TaxID=67267 RepID=A0A291W3R6_9ACTN|nr:hypothetical protein [Streptomyces alboflavus]ATM24658.1 hypothetical protein SMD44_p10159 [Streptomyces alboflavus]
MSQNITCRRTRARRVYTGEPHTTALEAARRHGAVLPSAASSSQRDLEARLLAALVGEFGVHSPDALKGAFALRWVGPREDSLLLAVAEPHRDRVLRCILQAGPDGSRSAPSLRQDRSSRRPITLLWPDGGTLLLPPNHGPDLHRAHEDLTARPSNEPHRGAPAWMGTAEGRERASTVLRRIRLFANHATVDFRTALPDDEVLAGPHPELLARARRPRTIAIANSKGGHGCSSLATGVAQALAAQGHRVLYLLTAGAAHQPGPPMQRYTWPKEDPGLAAVAQEPDQHVRFLPDLGYSFVRCSAPSADRPTTARQLALLLRHPAVDRAFSHVVIDASPSGMPEAAAGTADVTLVPWRQVPRPPGPDIIEVHLSPLGEAWGWLESAYRDSEPRVLDDYLVRAERLEAFTRERGPQDTDDRLKDMPERRLFLHDIDEAGHQKWGGLWEAARDGWIAHLLREHSARWDEAAGTRVRRTLSDGEWKEALERTVARAAAEVLEYLPISTGRRRPWLVPTTRMPADQLHKIRQGGSAQGLRLTSTVLPLTSHDAPPAARARWEEAARELTKEACIQLPQ